MSKQRRDWDLVILGGGSAGVAAATMAGGLGLKTLLIEKNRLGGERLNTGCVPSKALIHAAKVAHTLRTGGGIGLPRCIVTREDGAAALRHARESIERVRDAVPTEEILSEHGVEVSYGDTHFVSEDTLVLNRRPITSENFLLCTGSCPAVPDVPGLEEAGYLTNRTIFGQEEVPESLAVVGGGPEGVELAQAFARLGSAVTIVEENGRLLPRDDEELTGILAGRLQAEGIRILLDAPLESVRLEGGWKVLSLHGFGGPSETRAKEVLIATGRTPNVSHLHLTAAGVEVGRHGVVTDARMHTTGPRVWACGDVRGTYLYSHMAEAEARLAVQNIYLPVESRTDFRVAPWATFTDPEMAHVGLTETEAFDLGIRVDVLRQPFAADDRAIVEGATCGLVKVLTDGWRGRILGVSILGPRAGELITEWTLAMQHGLSIRAIADLVHVYPTLAMASRHAAQNWYEAKAREPAARKAISAYNKVRKDPEPILYTLAGVAAAGGLLWATKVWADREKKG